MQPADQQPIVFSCTCIKIITRPLSARTIWIIERSNNRSCSRDQSTTCVLDAFMPVPFVITFIPMFGPSTCVATCPDDRARGVKHAASKPHNIKGGPHKESHMKPSRHEENAQDNASAWCGINGT
eukprot:178106-Chlamydomonas_euryale.AAC.2